jgi:hypothetical protein
MNKIKLSIITIIAIVALSGCAAGQVGMYKGEIAANEGALFNLGPASEDNTEEARKRNIFENNIAEAKQKLNEVIKNNP